MNSHFEYEKIDSARIVRVSEGEKHQTVKYEIENDLDCVKEAISDHISEKCSEEDYAVIHPRRSKRFIPLAVVAGMLFSFLYSMNKHKSPCSYCNNLSSGGTRRNRRGRVRTHPHE